MDKTIKQKIRQLWRDRLFLSTIGLIIFGFSISQARSVLKHRPHQPTWAMELAPIVEEVGSSRESLQEKKPLYRDIRQIAEEKNLLATSCITNQRLNFKDFHHFQCEDNSTQETWSMAIVLQQNLEQSVSQVQYLSKGADRKSAFVRTLREADYQAKVIEKRLDQDLATRQEINHILTTIRNKNNEISLSTVQSLEHELTQISEKLPDDLLIAIINKETNKKYKIQLLRGETLRSISAQVLNRNRALYKSLISLSISLAFLGLILFSLSRLKGAYRFSWDTQMSIFIPEEYTVEVSKLRQRMHRNNISTRKINLRITEEYLRLFWAFHIQIRIENLFLPSSSHRTDD